MGLLEWGQLALGAATTISGISASSNQADAIDSSTQTATDQLDFAKQQYADYQDLYGEVNQNLSDYYTSLTPEQYTTSGLDAYDEQFKAAQSSWSQTMAQRGMSGSGVEAEGMLSMEAQGAQNRATIQQQAPQQWAADQMGYAAMGAGQSSIATQNIASSASNLSNIYGNSANVYGSQASAAGTAVGSMISNAMYANAYGNNANTNTTNSWTYNNPSVASGAISYN